MKRSAWMVVFLFLLLQAGYSATPQSTAFTYQGALSENGQPANGNFDLIFKLFDAETNGNQVGSTITETSFPVASGKFSVDLDFLAGTFTGNQLWIEVTVGTETLTPRQPINSVPVAQYALASPLQVPPAIFMSSASSATLTTNVSGNATQVAVLPLSGYTNPAYAAQIIGGLGWVDLSPSGANTPPAPQLFATDATIGTVRARVVLEQPYNGPAGFISVTIFTAFLGAGALTSPTTAVCIVPISAGPTPTASAYDCLQTGLATPFTAGTGAVIVVSLTSSATTSLQAQVAVSVGP
jgi:hypothetical protein